MSKPISIKKSEKETSNDKASSYLTLERLAEVMGV